MAISRTEAPKYVTHLTRASTDDEGKPRTAFKTLEKILKDGKLIASDQFILQPMVLYQGYSRLDPSRPNKVCSFSAVELFSIYKELVQFRKDAIKKGIQCLDIDPYGIIERVDSYSAINLDYEKDPNKKHSGDFLNRYLGTTRKRDFEFKLDVNGQELREVEHVPELFMRDGPEDDYYLRRKKSTMKELENISWEWEDEFAKKGDFELSSKYIILVKRAIEKTYLRMAFTLDSMNSYAKKKLAVFSFEELNGLAEDGIPEEYSAPEITESDIDPMIEMLAKEGKSEQADMICAGQVYDPEKRVYSKVLEEWSTAPLEQR